MKIRFENMPPELCEKTTKQIIVNEKSIGEISEHLDVTRGGKFTVSIRVPGILCALMYGCGRTREEAVLRALVDGEKQACEYAEFVHNLKKDLDV